MVFHRSLSDCISPPIPWDFISILADIIITTITIIIQFSALLLVSYNVLPRFYQRPRVKECCVCMYFIYFEQPLLGVTFSFIFIVLS